ncbi:MAG: glycosyltransferase family 39 protein [Bacteroidota bacterium]|nr:glycosyltransferase family 39 protein [Bacteroidota bacterium]
MKSFFTTKINLTTNNNQNYYFGIFASAIIAFGLFLNAIQPGLILTDGGIFSSIAFKIQNHGTLYIDAWENKPPGIFYLIAIFYFIIPSKVYALFIMSSIVFVLTSLLVYDIYFRVLQSLFKSILFTAISLMFIIYPNNIGDGLYTEIYGTFFILLSIFFWDLYQSNESNKNGFLSMFTLGLSFWFKEPFIFVCIPLGIYYLWNLKHKKHMKIFIVSFIAPSLFFIIILLVTGSLKGFIDMIIYNFTYLNSDVGVPIKEKLSDLYDNFIDKLLVLVIVYTLLLISKSDTQIIRRNKIFWLTILMSSSLFFLLTPYNFGHYYYVFFTLFFVVFIKTYHASIHNLPIVKLLFIPILLWSIFQLNKTNALNLTFKLKPYQADAISSRLMRDKGKSLFVDCVEEGGYYVKGNVMFNTFLPVALPVHFSDERSGIENRKKLWNELSSNPPEYIIRYQYTSYYYWNLPHNGFYDNEYSVIDSTLNFNQQKIFLLQYLKK